MMRYRPLLDTTAVRVGRFDHPGKHEHRDPPEEFSGEYSISRVERGSFAVAVGRKRWMLNPGDLFLNYPGMVYRCEHLETIPTDVCVAIAYGPLSAELEQAVQLMQVARVLPVIPASNRISYLFLRAASGVHEPMAAEEAAYAVMGEIHPDRALERRRYRTQKLSWYAERVDGTRQRIDRGYATEHRLVDLARSARMSPYHFARVFRELVGMPPHAYLCRVRLEHAARLLREGASVTEACFGSGFQNLSHFSRRFYLHFGVRASQYNLRARK